MLSVYKGRHHQNGFTLVEVTITVIILGIILSVAAVSYARTSDGVSMTGAKRQVETAINRAITSSRQENVSYRIVFYPRTDAAHPNSYEFLRNVESSGSWSMQPFDGSVSGERVTADGGHYYIKLEGGVNLTNNSVVTIDIVPSGTTLQVTEAVVYLERGSASSSVTVNSQGKVKAQ